MTWENGRELKSFTKDGKTTNFTYDINDMRTSKRTGNTITDYYYDDNNVLYGLRYQSNYFFFYYDENGEISSMLVDGYVPYFFEKNAQGDIIGIINENGERVVSYTYDAWGNPTTTLDANGNDVTNGAWAKAVPFRYRGYIYDVETGLYYLQSRFYDPQTGRFVNADAYTNTETGTPYSANMFAYCENNPVMSIDPTGYWHYKKHRRITRLQGFKGKKYKLVRDWTMLADSYPCASTGDYSAPFHSRITGLEKATELYNLALGIRDDYVKKRFSFDDPSYGIVYNIDFLKYKAHKESGKSKMYDAETDFLNILFDEAETAADQSKILLGLALHIMQDYLAHMVEVELSYVEYNNLLNTTSKRIQYKNEEETPIYMWQVDDIMGLGKTEIEDDKTVFKWRYRMAKVITKKVYNKWISGERIDEISISPNGKVQKRKKTVSTLWWGTVWRMRVEKCTLNFK